VADSRSGRYTATGDDLNQVQAKIDADGAEITAFLTWRGQRGRGGDRAAASRSPAQAYRPEGPADNRFIIAQTILARTGRSTCAHRTTGELVSRAVLDTAARLMCSPAERDCRRCCRGERCRAREAAEQFARDSGSALGGIRRANQGMFEILPRDRAQGITEEGQLHKTVRVVSTVDYDLE
jgi:hypothetical protein